MGLEVTMVAIIVGGWIAGKASEAVRLPPVLGMTLWGVLLTWSMPQLVDASIWLLAPSLKNLSLVIILLRAGLGIRRSTLNRVGARAVALGVVPSVVEAAVLTPALMFLFGFTLPAAMTTGFLIAAVSPAVVVPSMIELTEQGYGRRNEIPTMVLAGASLDVVFCIAMVTLLADVASGDGGGLWRIAINLPVALAGGVIPGAALGLGLAWFLNRQSRQVRATEKALLVLGLALLLLRVGDWLHVAATLGVMTLGFVVLEKAEPVAHELAGKLSKAWVFAEILLFVLIGMSVDLPVAISAGAKGAGLLVLGLVGRSLATWAVTGFGTLSPRERGFVVLAYLPKASVQAAMGGVPLAYGIAGGDIALALAVLAIVLTAPLGLLAIRWSAPRLLDAVPESPGPSTQSLD